MNREQKRKEERQKKMYPSFENCDSGKLYIQPTDKFPFVRINVVNKDFPGVIVMDIEKLEQAIKSTKEKF